MSKTQRKNINRTRLKRQCHEKFTIFEQNEATIPLFIYKTILKRQEKEIHQEEQVIVGYSLF